ncbi:regulator of cell wall mannosyl phosphorylation [Scheffersomyces amazonensis]|uniref:regulator of cell wall mannosyl phosphorylation n=1 Tax=Scheffersomyces amazonensis TaxID=1078765 RepID=UPI00315C78BE
MISPLKFPRKLFISKLFILSVVTYTIIFSLTAFLNQKSFLQRYTSKINSQINIHYAKWRNNFLTTEYNLESNPEFLHQLHDLKQQEILTNDDLWFLREDSQLSIPLELEIPHYFESEILVKPMIQHFDPRFTLAVYMNYLTQFETQDKIKFHWSDWVDMTKLYKYILNPHKGESADLCDKLFNILAKTEEPDKVHNFRDYCSADYDGFLGFKINEFTGPQTLENREILGKAYLYSSAPSPFKIVFLTNDDRSIEFEVDSLENDRKNSLLSNGYIHSMMKNGGILHKKDIVNVADAFKGFIKNRLESKSTESKKVKDGVSTLTKSHIIMNESDFDFTKEDIDNVLKQDFSELPHFSEQNYYRGVEFSSSTNDPPKYFGEAKMIKEVDGFMHGEHYDWRFFNGLILEHEDQILSLHRLIKNYLNFCRTNGIKTWIAHGSLLSWYWNGMGFPWDNDIDVQMPIRDLHKLARHFNQSLVVENIVGKDGQFDGMGRYFIDVGSSITHRKNGNGNNNIDARFIDVDTGLYIDITGLALTDEPAPSRYDILIQMDPNKKAAVENSKERNEGNLDHLVKNQQLQAYNCRNRHFNILDELSPLVKTIVENQVSYVPKNFLVPLNNEYDVKSIIEKDFKEYIFVNNLRIWMKTQSILDYFKKIGRPSELNLFKDLNSIKSFNKEVRKLQLNKLDIEDHLNLLKNNKYFKEFFTSKEFTKFHELELEQLSKDPVDYNVDEFIKEVKEFTLPELNIGKPLKADLFMNKVFQDSKTYDYNKKIDEVLKLTKEYINEIEDLTKKSKQERNKKSSE